MSVREYIGARYIPTFADPSTWDIDSSYEPLTVVTYQGASYVSRQYVPPQIQLNNTDYWVLWADYNAQIEAYRQEVQTYNGRIEALEKDLPVNDFDENATVKDAFDAVNALLPASDFTSDATVKDAIDAVNALLPASDFTSDATVKDAIDNIGEELDEVKKIYELPTDIQGAKAVFRNVYNNSQYTVQGLCVFPYENPMYIAVSVQNTSNAESTITIYSLTGSLIGSITGQFGHSSIISYNNNLLYVTGHNENKNMYVIDVSIPSNPTYANVITNTNANLIPLSYYKNGKILYMDVWTGTRNLYAYDPTTQTNELVIAVPEKKINGLLQSVKYCEALNMFALLESGAPGQLTLWNENVIKTLTFEPTYNFILTDEIEDFSFVENGKGLYFINNISALQSYQCEKAYTVFYTDIYDSSRYSVKINPYGGERFMIKIDPTASPIYDDNYNGNNEIGTNSSHPLRVKYPFDLMAMGYYLTGIAATIIIETDVLNTIIPINGGGNNHNVNLNNHRCGGLVFFNGTFALLGAGSAFTNNSDWLQSRDSKPVLVSATEAMVMLQNYLSADSVGNIFLVDAVDSSVYLRDTTNTGYVNVVRCSYVTNGLHV